MKKSLAPIVIILIVVSVVFFAIMPSTPQATKRLQEEISEAVADGKTVFLQLSSTGCVTCRKMKPEVEKALAEFENSNRHKIINIDVNSHKAIASHFAITGVPTQVILSGEGKEVFRNMGYMSFDNIKYAMTTATK
ncbi:thioredoxin family protein [Deferribacteres bacterium DY0037]